MLETPICRHFVACNDIRADSTKDQTLVNVFHMIVVPKGEFFPAKKDVICFYGVFSNGRGIHQLRVEIVFGVGDNERVDYRSSTFERDFGQDPLVVHSLPIRIKEFFILNEGQYDIRLICDESVIANVFLEVRKIHE